MTLSSHLNPANKVKFPIDYANTQLKIFWLPDEIKVEKDVQDVLVNMTPAEKHGVITTLKLFSLYETHAGSEYWGGRFREMFKDDDSSFERMASVFSMFELAVHAPFYNKINELLHLNDVNFYTSYEQVPALKARIDHIGQMINHEDPHVSLAAFSLVEGVILYSSFAFLKHFQSQGKNRLMNIVRGINFSVRDENLHSEGGADSFKYLTMRTYGDSWHTVQDTYYNQIMSVAVKIVEHEDEIIDMIFSQGKIEGITAHQLKQFVRSRVNICMQRLGFGKVYDITYNPVADWFYKGINGYQFNDFFSGMGNQYNREWNETGFTWKANNE
jgi:ribonucleotide reductase beta subunit family protein with ferritin-like domain